MRIRVLGQYVQGSMTVLAAVELLVFVGALLCAVLLRFQENLAQVQLRVGPLWPRLVLFGAAMLVSLLAFGLYSARQRARMGGIFVRLIAAVIAGTAVTTVCFYLIPNIWIGRGVISLAAAVAVFGLVLSRTTFARVVGEDLFKRRVLVFGCGQRAAAISNLRRRADRRGFTLAGFVRAHGEECAIPQERLLQAGDSLLHLCRFHAIDEVVVAMDDRRRAFPIGELLECRLAGIDVTELLSFLERETGRVRIDVLNPSWMIFGEGFRRDNLRLFTARVLDLIAGVLILVLGSPVMLATALAIKFEDGWRAPVLYRQERVGFGGRTFRLLKFRSMRVDAEAGGEALWAQKNDPRVTRVGALIRKVRVDELPQVFNVLCGQMSFVGPRPERPQFVARLAEKIPYYVQRHCVKPGITGWAQLCYPYGSSEQDALEKLQYDLYYIKNNSLLLDLSILVQTAEVVLMSKGAR